MNRRSFLGMLAGAPLVSLPKPETKIASRPPSRALAMLQVDEWTMGNGQCPDCHGMGPPMLWGNVWKESDLGHTPGCARATAMTELGGSPLMYRPS
jgi:hypothetical protein